MKNATFTPITYNNDLYLLAIPVPVDAPLEQVRQPVHHFFSIDKSGSMHRTLPELIEDLKKQVRLLEKGDAVTFGWFSSKNEFGFPIKCFRIVDEQSFAELDRLFDLHKESLNLTCFSDALREIEINNFQ